MKIPWTSWKDRRSCPAVSVKGITGPLAVHTRTHLVLCRRSWPSSWVCPREIKRRQQVRKLYDVLLSIFGEPIVHFFFHFFITIILLWYLEPEPATPVQNKTGKYVPPSLRDGSTRRGESMQPNRRGTCLTFRSQTMMFSIKSLMVTWWCFLCSWW